MFSKHLKRILILVIAVTVVTLGVAPAGGTLFGNDSSTAYAATKYFKTWGTDISEADFQKMAKKWPNYEPKRCNGWMTEVMNDVYKIPMKMGNWVSGTRSNFLKNSTVKPVKVVSGTYATIKKNIGLVKPGDIVFFNSSKKGKGVWTHVALVGEDHMLWHCTATSPGKKTGKYKSLTSWMKKYRKQGQYGAYAEVWRVLSTFSADSTVKITSGSYNGQKYTAKYSKGDQITVVESINYKASGPVVGKYVSITASLNKNIKTDNDGNVTYSKGTKITSGQKYKGSTKLSFKLKKSGTINIYYRFKVSESLADTDTMSVFTKIEYGGKTLKNYSKAKDKKRTIEFYHVEPVSEEPEPVVPDDPPSEPPAEPQPGTDDPAGVPQG